MTDLSLDTHLLHGWNSSEVKVFAFHGVEAVSSTYQFEVGVYVPETFSTVDAIGHHTTFRYPGGGADGDDFVIHGKLAAIESVGHFEGHVTLKIVVVPLLWNLSLAQHSRAWTGCTVPDIIREVLGAWSYTDHGKTPNLEFRLLNPAVYAKRDLVCQYNETDLAFISRWMEREGLFYYFEQPYDGAGERLIITDRLPRMLDDSPTEHLHYRKATPQKNALEEFRGRLKALSYGVAARDYDYNRPGTPISGGLQRVPQRNQYTAHLDQVMLYGEHLLSIAEATRIAQVRADALGAQRHVLEGRGSVHGLRAGYTFHFGSDLHGHDGPPQDRFFVTSVEHWGASKAAAGERALEAFEHSLTASIGRITKSEKQGAGDFAYRMSFTCVPAGEKDVYRHPQVTPIPVIHSMVRGTATGNFAYSKDPELGHNVNVRLYEVQLDFNENEKVLANARLVQPHGAMQFNLQKNAEVVVEFTAGNVDRPIITNVAPSAATANPDPPPGVNVIQSDSLNKVELDDNPGSQSITTSSPINESYLRLGEIPDATMMPGPWNAHLHTLGSTKFTVGQQWYVQAGQAVTHDYADDYQLSLGQPTEQRYSLKVERVATEYPRVTEQAGQVVRNAAGPVTHTFQKDHDLTVGNDHEVTVAQNHRVAVTQGEHSLTVGQHYTMRVTNDGAQTIQASALNLGSGGTSVNFGQNLTTQVASDQVVHVNGTTTLSATSQYIAVGMHQATASGNYEITAGEGGSGVYQLTVGASGMTVDSSGFSHPAGHTVTVQGTHTMIVNQDHNVRVTNNYALRGTSASITAGHSIQISSPLTIIN